MHKNIARLVLGGMALLLSVTQAASAGGSTDSRAKPTSFVPHAQSNSHVYGSPIGQPIVGHSKASHHKQAPKKRS
jgi:hypothetical protein